MNDKVRLKPMQLKVKRNNPEKEKNSKYYNDSVFVILLSVFLLFVTITLIIIVLYKSPDDGLTTKITLNPLVDKSDTLFNKWRSNNDSLFIFGSDLKFSWYENYKDLDNNYYLGTYTYKTNKDAIKETGYTEEEFKQSFPHVSDYNKVYSLQIKPNYLYKNNLNVTKTQVSKNETWWFIIIISDDGTVNAYNKTLDTRYQLKLES